MEWRGDVEVEREGFAGAQKVTGGVRKLEEQQNGG
jgi:hypothetical protein